MKTTTTKKNTMMAEVLVCAGLMLTAAGCGGGGGGSAAVPSAPSVETREVGAITGTIETGTQAAAVTSEALTASGARVYALGAGTVVKDIALSSALPSAVTDSQGAFTIENLGAGLYLLVVDLDGNGVPDGLVNNVAVSVRQLTSIGRRNISELASALTALLGTVPAVTVETGAGTVATVEKTLRKGTWCDVDLDKTFYAIGETVRIGISGRNDTDHAIKCGARIMLKKSSSRTEVWRSDFTVTYTYVTIVAHAAGSGTVEKVIPDVWSLSNSSTGSDYHVYPVTDTGAVSGKGDNFNIPYARQCSGSGCSIATPVACQSDFDCGDEFMSTADTCVSPGTESSYCEFKPY